MYTVEVFPRGSPLAGERHEYKLARDVLAAIPALLRRHEGCEKLVVSLNAKPLFAVDCEGNRLSE